VRTANLTCPCRVEYSKNPNDRKPHGTPPVS
jgi:hypothetical protein